MKIENAIAHVICTIKDYKSQPFITCTPLFESIICYKSSCVNNNFLCL